MSRAVIANLQSFLDRWPGELLGDGFDGDADNIREAIAEIRRLDRLTSPAHTSEARDGDRLDWLDAKCRNVADEHGIASQLYFGTYATGKLRESIDAAMRQEAGDE